MGFRRVRARYPRPLRREEQARAGQIGHKRVVPTVLDRPPAASTRDGGEFAYGAQLEREAAHPGRLGGPLRVPGTLP